jgi:hypothetical protein
MYTADCLEKAQIEISIKKLDCDFKPEPLGAAMISASITQYVNSTLQMEQQMEETFGPQTSNMRIPYDYSESGIQSTNNVPLPAVAYIMAETPKSNDLYWENAFITIMKRDSLKPEDWERLNIIGKARVGVLVVCYLTQYLDYIGDTVDRNVKGKKFDPNNVKPYENFGDALGMGSADCEDDACAIIETYNAFIIHIFKPNGQYYKIMVEMQRITRKFLPLLSLDVVRGAQVSDRTQNYGAHMNVNFFPQEMFRKALESTREGRLLSKNLPWDSDDPIEGLPFLVGEGTGMYEPYGVENPLLPIMGYVYQCQSLEGFKKPITRKPGQTGNFFVGSLVGLMDYFYKRGTKTPHSFWYTTDGKRGASYEDMMNNPERVGIKIHPTVSASVMSEMAEKTLRRLPPEPLILSPLAKDAKRRHNSVLNHISKTVEQWNRPKGNMYQKVPVYVRSHQLSTEIGNQIISDFKKLGRIWKVDYELEEITDKIFGYKMDVYVN